MGKFDTVSSPATNPIKFQNKTLSPDIILKSASMNILLVQSKKLLVIRRKNSTFSTLILAKPLWKIMYFKFGDVQSLHIGYNKAFKFRAIPLFQPQFSVTFHIKKRSYTIHLWASKTINKTLFKMCKMIGTKVTGVKFKKSIKT